MDQEKLGPADKILQSVLAYTDHMVHNRPGIVVPDGRTTVGVRWDFATYKMEGGLKIAYRLTKEGNKTVRARVGVIGAGREVTEGGRRVGEWRPAGIFPEVAKWMYEQVAEVWQMDNEFAARWASYAFGQDHRDLKVVLCAFMLVQSRKGDPVVDAGNGKMDVRKVEFYDDDFRDVGEAMMLLYKKDGKDLHPRFLLRIREVLEIPGVAEINRKLGFTRSAREPALGRWSKVIHKWLRYREQNPRLLNGLVKAGMRNAVVSLAQRSGYKPESAGFFEVLRWRQSQSADGRRRMAIGTAVKPADSWEGLSEREICERIVSEKPSWKKVVGMLPTSVGVTRAVMAAAVESGSLSDKELVIATVTLEELGLTEVPSVRLRWEAAVRRSTDMRAANVAARVKGKEVKEKLAEAGDHAVKNATEEVLRDMKVYVFVDRSGSMSVAIEGAKALLGKLLPAFPKEKVRCAYFNTVGNEVTFKASSAAGVEQAFRGVTGSGATDYGAGVRALSKYKPAEGEDVLMIFVGDQQAEPFDRSVTESGLRPMAFGFVYTPGTEGEGRRAVEMTAVRLGVPCFRIDEKTFADTYAVPRTLRALIAATPVGTRGDTGERRKRETLAETIAKTEILSKPAWAA